MKTLHLSDMIVIRKEKQRRIMDYASFELGHKLYLIDTRQKSTGPAEIPIL